MMEDMRFKFSSENLEELKKSQIRAASECFGEEAAEEASEYISNYWKDFEHGGYSFHRGRWFTTKKYFLQTKHCTAKDYGTYFIHEFESESEVTEEMWRQKAEEMIAHESQYSDRQITDFADKESALEHWNKGANVLSPCGKFILDDQDIEEHFGLAVGGE